MSERASERETDRKKRERETLALQPFQRKRKKKKKRIVTGRLKRHEISKIYEFVYFSFFLSRPLISITH